MRMIGFAARRLFELAVKTVLFEFTSAAFEQNSKMRDRMSNKFSEARLRRAGWPILVGLPERPYRRQ